MNIRFKIIPKNSPKLCGKCAEMGDNCICDCHKEAIFAGWHEVCYSMEFNIPPFSKQDAEARGYVFKENIQSK